MTTQPDPLAALIACAAGAQQGDREREARAERAWRELSKRLRKERKAKALKQREVGR